MENEFEKGFWEVYDRAEELAKKDPEWRFLEEQIHHALDRFETVEGLQDRLITPIDKQYVLFMKKIYEVMHQNEAAATQKAVLPHVDHKDIKH